MATTPSVHSRRDANSPDGVQNSYVPFSDGTHGRHRTGAPALAAIGTLKRPLIFLFLALTLLFAVAACATADNPSRGERASSGASLTLLPDDTTRLEVLKVGDILGGAVPESFEERFEAQWELYSLGDDIVTIDDIGEIVRAYSKDGEILMLSGTQIDFAGIRDWLDSEEANIERSFVPGSRPVGRRQPGPGYPRQLPDPGRHRSAQGNPEGQGARRRRVAESSLRELAEEGI